jgi:hypothetical protein
MAERIEEVVKHGRWFFDETVPAEVRIIRRNFVEPPDPGEELPYGWTGDAPPPYGPDGFYNAAGLGFGSTRSRMTHGPRWNGRLMMW